MHDDHPPGPGTAAPPVLVCLGDPAAAPATPAAFAAQRDGLDPDLRVETWAPPAAAGAAAAPDDAAFAEAVRTIGAGRPVHLLGFGAAAPAAVTLAARRPGLVRGLVLAGPHAAPSGTPLDGVTAPTLVICGDDDRVAGEPVAQTYAGGVRDAVFVTVAGAGHRVHDERPDAFNAWVRSFAQIAEGLPHRADTRRSAT
ncbi:alpha/beta fold hydrolase [Actinomadura sediminis]|uniref:Alpha/beta fold hydrolase n=1 Tax=Actinomadura sediminis TaxID=1038904 RepID=A0ABW3EJU7_9ACTN